MDIKDIDKNFDTSFEAPADLEWFSARETPFSTHGVYYAEEEGLYRRIPKEVADSVSVGVSHLSKNTAGGRIRFITDSPYVAVRAVEPFEPPFSHMAISGKCGVTIFANHTFLGTVMPSYAQLKEGDPSLGGTGKIGGVILGVVLLRLIFVGLTFLGIDANMQYIIKGLIILIACAIDMRKYLVKK